FENLAVRPSGKLLLTSVVSSVLHTLDPASPNATLEEVYTFSNSTGLTGIVEYQPDVYAVVASTLNLTTRRADPGSVAVWRIDLTCTPAAATRLAVVPQSALLNGLSAVPGAPHLVLAADSYLGAVYAIDMRTGAARVALQDAAMAPGAPAPALGINGLRVRGGALYFTNSERGTFARVPLAVHDRLVRQAGGVEVLGTVQPAAGQFDDFAMDCEGRTWIATPPGALTLVFPQANATWGQEVAVGDTDGSDSVFTEPTSAAFGRVENKEDKILYVTTSG
ncbi:hypothetical protein FB451DRAFT_1000092, partial [Mycena latifolia]